MGFFYQELLDRYGGAGAGQPCSCGRRHAIVTRSVLLGDDALARSAEQLRSALPAGATAWVLSDERTEEAAAREWKYRAAGRRGGPRIVEHVLPGAPRPVPTIELVRSLSGLAREAHPALLVAVGSGVLSDLGKQVSHETGVPNWCIATAASVDAYTSGTAAIRVEGYHRALATGISELVACDLGVIGRAPRELAFAGLGDLLAKIIARMDWDLARIMAGEHYCQVISDASLGSARQALQAARQMRGRPAEAVRTLVDAALTSGFAMQAYGGSRPAASAEHTIAHFWEMTGSVGNERWDLHGALVGSASRLVLRIYRRLFALLADFTPAREARLSAFDREAPWMERVEPSMRPYLPKIREEVEKRSLDRSELARRIAAFEEHRARIVALGTEFLDELEAAVGLLEGLGYPFALREIGVPPEVVLTSVRNVQLLRSRYSSFDLAYELGLGEELVVEAGRYVEEQYR
jgi:glycerol-1-phosphate dehydrogenase [NAD(P)+]